MVNRDRRSPEETTRVYVAPIQQLQVSSSGSWVKAAEDGPSFSVTWSLTLSNSERGERAEDGPSFSVMCIHSRSLIQSMVITGRNNF